MTDKSVEMMWKWINDLFPICRSITGKGNVQTLEYLKNINKELVIQSVPTGYKAFDWDVPNEWNPLHARLYDPSGKKILDFDESNLHLIGYSTSFEGSLSLDELKENLYTLPDQPNAIPYITSYYKERWGLCMKYEQYKSLQAGMYYVDIKTELKPGRLHFADTVIKGKSEKEILLSTYICHPSLANNELSGPIVSTALLKWIKSERRKYTYRFVYVPETIGSIVYLSKNIDELKQSVIAGFNITCIGDELTYSYLPSRNGNTLSDKAAIHILKYRTEHYDTYTWLDRGSDERQYCAPGVDLPIASVMRSKDGVYSQYHTSEDNLEFVTQKGLEGGLNIYMQIIGAIEMNCIPVVKTLGEPQLGKRDLYPSLSIKNNGNSIQDMMNLLTYSDGKRDLIDICNIIDVCIEDLWPTVSKLEKAGVIELQEINGN